MFGNLIFNLRRLTSNEEFGNPICFRTSFNSVCMGAKVDVTRHAQYGSFTLEESGSKSEKKSKKKRQISNELFVFTRHEWTLKQQQVLMSKTKVFSMLRFLFKPEESPVTSGL